MVADTRLCDYRNVAAERSVPALEQQDVFFRRQIHIGFTVDRNDRDPGGSNWRQGIHWIGFVRHSLFFSEAIDLLQSQPIIDGTFGSALASRPALEIAYGRVEIEAGDGLRVERRPIQRKKRAPAESLQNALR